MNSRESILAAVAKNKPVLFPLPDIGKLGSAGSEPVEKFTSVAVNIGRF